MSLDHGKIEILLGFSVVFLFSTKYDDDRRKENVTAVIGSPCHNLVISSAVFQGCKFIKNSCVRQTKKGTILLHLTFEVFERYVRFG